ncbi:MAG: HlyD family efflux transporter periplasmic adaptor subunit [Lachnospiraceae bacterium]|nr:HlyD family efflux transporter periplasmic adaptor subunit [Lachnospiraceae bacterium]
MDRKKIFQIFGGFLAVMLVFTILSRAVSGASMARVETVKIATGTIEHRVSGSGRVEAGKEVAVYTESGQRVKEICVQEGQTVEEGELLFQIDLEKLEEQILTARQELEKEKLQNQDAQSARNIELQNRDVAKNRAQEDYNQAVTNGEISVAEAKAAWDNAQRALEEFLQKSQQESQNKDIEGKLEKMGVGNKDSKEDEEEKGEPDGADNPQKETEEEQKAGEEENSGANDKTDWEAQKAQLEQAAAEAKAAYDAAVSSRADNVKNAARALEDASRQPATDTTSKQNEITRQQQELALSKLLALKEAEGKITAPVRGVVTQIAVTTGDFTTDGTALRLADTSQGSRLRVSVDKNQEKYVQKGSPVTISASGSKEKINDYTVTNVTGNEEDKTLLDIVIDLPEGVLEAGTMADVEVVQKSKNYSAVIPIQALHESQEGSYVLIAEEQQGVMGKELVVKRLSVNVVDKNSTKAALEEGLLTGEQEIISSSSRLIEEGSRVRKKET